MQTLTVSNAVLTNTVRAYPGCRMHFRISSDETNNALSVVDILTTAGAEPPRHTHDLEDELVFLKKGEVNFYVGDQLITAKAGDTIFMPRGVPHHFKVMSEKALVTLVITPGGFDRFFEAITTPYEGESAPPLAGAPTPEQISYFAAISESFGLKYAH